MANTLNGMTYDNIAKAGLDTFVDALCPLSVFTLDLSSEVKEQGTTVSTRIVPAITGTVGDLTDTHTGLYTDAIDDYSTSQVQVTLGSEPIIGFHLTDAEMAQVGAGVMSDTVARLIKAHAYAVANSILDTIWATVDTSFGTGVSAVAASAFDADDVADLRNYCVTTGAWHMTGEESLVLDSSYYTALLKDNAIQDRSASGLDTLISGKVPMCCGFRVIEAPSLAGAAVNNTGGFACKPYAMAIAMRGVSTQSENDFLHYEVLQDDQTGIVLTYKAWFDRSYHRVYHTFETLWGRADANTSAIARITSA